MQNPFTTTFSRLPEDTYIITTAPEMIIENFSYDSPSEAIYKITGIRGSGKTVIMSNVQETMKSPEYAKKGWLVYTLNPSRDMLSQFAAYLYSEDFIKKSVKSKSININASVFGTGGGIGYAKTEDDKYFDIGVEIRKMLDIVQSKKKKVLLCVDEVSKTPEMITFSLEFGGWMISGLPVYIICTGLYENVTEISNVKNLTFFRRGTSIITAPLNHTRMCEMYKNKLKIDIDLAKKLATITKGYAYAFQQLGSIYFQKGNKVSLEEVVDELRASLFSYSYEKIWEELSDEDRFLTSLITDKEQYKRAEVLDLMGDKMKNYSVYRDRLIKRGVISAKQGYISIYPPFFSEYVKEYGVV